MKFMKYSRIEFERRISKHFQKMYILPEDRKPTYTGNGNASSSHPLVESFFESNVIATIGPISVLSRI